MTEPRQVTATQADPADLARLRADRDRLLDELRTMNLPGWVWTKIDSRLSDLDALGDGMAWAPVRFLQTVKINGPKMFQPDGVQPGLDGVTGEEAAAPGAPPLRCPCGGLTGPVEKGTVKGGRGWRLGTCGACGKELVRWVESPL